MKVFFNIVVLALFGVMSNTQAQELEAVTEILAKVEARYSANEAYNLEVLYQYFEQDNMQQAVETMEGQIIKEGPNYYSRIHHTETVFIDSDYLKINHDEKAVLYGSIDPSQRPAPVELSKLSAYFSSAEVYEKGEVTRFELLFKEAQMIPYSKMVLEINLKSNTLLKQELYLLAGKQMPGGQNPLAKTTAGVVSISFTEHPFKEEHRKHFLISDYIKKGPQLSLSKKLATYSLYQ